jgi:hypothetical protein
MDFCPAHAHSSSKSHFQGEGATIEEGGVSSRLGVVVHVCGGLGRVQGVKATARRSHVGVVVHRHLMYKCTVITKLTGTKTNYEQEKGVSVCLL